MQKQYCAECESEREDFSTACKSCGAPPLQELRQGEVAEKSVRTTDLEPYIALRYIAWLFKILAVLMAVIMIGEVITGLVTEGRAAILTLLGEGTRMIVLAGLMWGVGDLAILLIDAGHDLRVARILLGRINARLHRTEGTAEEKPRRPEAVAVGDRNSAPSRTA